jgi:hypothetical protein
MSGMELVPIVGILIPGVAAYWFATPQGLVTRKEAPRDDGAEIVLPTSTTRAPPSDVISQLSPPLTSASSAVFHLSLEDAEDATQTLQSSQHTAQQQTE